MGLLLVLLAILLLGNIFLKLANEMMEGEVQRWDETIIRALRQADDPTLPIGPAWVREAGMDLTALGSLVVLGIVTALATGFLLLQRRRRYALLVLAAVLGGQALNSGLKQYFDRDRPNIVPHLREVSTPSFPSGHATLSAVTYLTLGVLLAEGLQRRAAKLYVILVALLLTFLVGASRVYLGVHYPTDVLAGWASGLAWALLCWIIAHLLHRRRTSHLAREIEGEQSAGGHETP